MIKKHWQTKVRRNKPSESTKNSKEIGRWKKSKFRAFLGGRAVQDRLLQGNWLSDRILEELLYITGHQSIQEIVRILLTGVYNSEICKQYPELGSSLKEDFFFYKRYHSSYCSLEDCRKLFLDMVPEVRRMFPQVEKILRLLLLSPASFCQAERSFSSLKRSKLGLEMPWHKND